MLMVMIILAMTSTDDDDWSIWSRMNERAGQSGNGARRIKNEEMFRTFTTYPDSLFPFHLVQFKSSFPHEHGFYPIWIYGVIFNQKMFRPPKSDLLGFAPWSFLRLRSIGERLNFQNFATSFNVRASLVFAPPSSSTRANFPWPRFCSFNIRSKTNS